MMRNFITEYRNYLKIVGLASRTIAIYTSILKKYLVLHPDPKLVPQAKIIEFMLQRGSARTIQQTHGALNHFYTGVLGMRSVHKIPRTKAPKYVPNILSQQEAYVLLNSIKNLKHEAILRLIYSCALRVGEALNLKISHISKTENKIKIVDGKGGKTAYVPIPEETKNLLRLYYHHYRPKVYLFEGVSGKKYSRSSVRKILNKSLLNAKIRTHIRIHDLRHSRATHLLENGLEIKILKDILRHKRIETTERYVHLTTSTLSSAMYRADAVMKLTLSKKQLLIKSA